MAVGGAAAAADEVEPVLLDEALDPGGELSRPGVRG
jgi:hypothetical protein